LTSNAPLSLILSLIPGMPTARAAPIVITTPALAKRCIDLVSSLTWMGSELGKALRNYLVNFQENPL
jgi:hypothetical protein